MGRECDLFLPVMEETPFHTKHSVWSEIPEQIGRGNNRRSYAERV